MGTVLQEWQREARRLDGACKELMKQNSELRGCVLLLRGACKAVLASEEGTMAEWADAMGKCKDALAATEPRP